MKPKFYDFIELFENNITVEHISSALECWDEDSEGKQDALEKMKEKGFDILPIKQNSCISSCITKDKEILDIEIQDLLSNSTPLTHVLELFRHNPKRKFFILKENKIDGILTIADLQKGPFCLLIFGLITNFEIMCLELIKHFNLEWEKVIPERKEKIQETYDKSKQKDGEIDKLYYTTLSDKLMILRNISEFNNILERNGWSSTNTRRILARIERLRNNLAHSRYIKTGFNKWEDLIDIIEKIETLTMEIQNYLV
ncbi:MAG: hypothetical protein ACTSR8_14030 [Promethearchaeota archaeon]